MANRFCRLCPDLRCGRQPCSVDGLVSHWATQSAPVSTAVCYPNFCFPDAASIARFNYDVLPCHQRYTSTRSVQICRNPFAPVRKPRSGVEVVHEPDPRRDCNELYTLRCYRHGLGCTRRHMAQHAGLCVWTDIAGGADTTNGGVGPLSLRMASIQCR